MARVGVGVDFGTTNSVAAFYDGDQLRLVDLESHGSVMPSATYIDQELQTKTGDLAIQQYITDNTGRTVELVPEVIGETSKFSESGNSEEPSEVDTVTEQIYGAPITDSGLQGRLFRGTKRLLGDERVRRLMVFDQPFRLVALITPILLRIRKALEKEVGKLDMVHIGHPVNFEGKERLRNKLALDRLGEAYKYAGIPGQEFYPEPVAAAVSFLSLHPDVQGETLLTLDFGGGTLDFCVLRKYRDQFEVLATHGIGMGGDHIDQLLFRELLFPLMGKGETWKRKGFDREIETRFPFEDFEDLLLNWAITYTLNQNRYTTPVMDCIRQGGPGKRKFERLQEVIKHNLSYLLFSAIKNFKADLSNHNEATLDIPEIDVNIMMNRMEFENLIQSPLQSVAKSLDETVSQAGLKLDEIDIVLGTGGSSLIPAVRAMLDERFPGKVVEHDPFTSVATGLAIANYHGYSVS